MILMGLIQLEIVYDSMNAISMLQALKESVQNTQPFC